GSARRRRRPIERQHRGTDQYEAKLAALGRRDRLTVELVGGVDPLGSRGDASTTGHAGWYRDRPDGLRRLERPSIVPAIEHRSDRVHRLRALSRLTRVHRTRQPERGPTGTNRSEPGFEARPARRRRKLGSAHATTGIGAS